MDVTAAEAAEVTSKVEVRLSEATSGMTEGTTIEACDWAAAPRPGRLSSPLRLVSSRTRASRRRQEEAKSTGIEVRDVLRASADVSRKSAQVTLKP